MKSENFNHLLNARANALIAISILEKSNEVAAAVALPNVRAALGYIEDAMSEGDNGDDACEDTDDWLDFDDGPVDGE